MIFWLPSGGYYPSSFVSMGRGGAGDGIEVYQTALNRLCEEMRQEMFRPERARVLAEATEALSEQYRNHPIG